MEKSQIDDLTAVLWALKQSIDALRKDIKDNREIESVKQQRAEIERMARQTMQSINLR